MVEQRTSIAEADPYLLFGLLGKRVIHRGGRHATDQLLAEAELRPELRVLDIGCGAATTTVEIARRFGSTVVAADISVDMRDRASQYVRRAGLGACVLEAGPNRCAAG